MKEKLIRIFKGRENNTRDLTTGNSFKLILEFAIPIYFGIIFQNIYGLVDSVIVGRTLGVDQLAAVGATGAITFMVLGLCNGIASGFAIPVAHYLGAKDEKGLKSSMVNGIYMGLIISAVVTFLVSFFCMDILEFMNTPGNIIQYSYEYLLIIFLGLPITFFYNLFSGYMRSLGDSSTPVIILIICCLINIVLDYYFIVNLHFGIAGAGYATVISQFIAIIVSMIYMWWKFPIVHMKRNEWHFSFPMSMHLCFMGIPMGLQYSITAVGSVILQTSVNELGSSYVASMTAAIRIALFAVCMTDALGATMATFAGQNLGAKKLDRITIGLKQSCVIGIIYAVVACAIVSIFGEKLALLFVEASETEIIHNIGLYLKIESGFYLFLVFIGCIRFSIQGMGYSGLAMISGVMELIARVLAVIFLIPRFGYVGACLASPIAWVMADLFLFPAYFYVMKKTKKRLECN